jgi:hypothetical protein
VFQLSPLNKTVPNPSTELGAGLKEPVKGAVIIAIVATLHGVVGIL